MNIQRAQVSVLRERIPNHYKWAIKMSAKLTYVVFVWEVWGFFVICLVGFFNRTTNKGDSYHKLQIDIFKIGSGK